MFSHQGFNLKNNLIKSGPHFAKIFENLIPLNDQKALLTKHYRIWQSRIPNLKSNKNLDSFYKTYPLNDDLDEDLSNYINKEVKQEGFKSSYFNSVRNFASIIPYKYQATEAPRLTVAGATLHALRKDIKQTLLLDLSRKYNITFVEPDLSACHARVAAALIGPHSSLHKLFDPHINFWDEQTTINLEKYKFSNIEISPKSLRATLKVCLYTSLNGGNPSSDERVFETLKANAKDKFKFQGKFIENRDAVFRDPLFRKTKIVFDEFQISNELKSFNKSCVYEGPPGSKGPTFLTHTIDRPEVYSCDTPHKGISRVLQGFEIVLLSVLVKNVIETGGLPVSLDHDGLIIAYPGSLNSADKTDLESLLFKSSQDWSSYLVQTPVPIEIKNVYSPDVRLS